MDEAPRNREDVARTLGGLRRDINDTDGRILELLNKRASLSLEVGRAKAGAADMVFKPLREQEVLDGLVARNPGPMPGEHVRAIWREILSSSRALQRPQHVAYLGPEGTFSYFAGREYLGHAAVLHPCADIAQVFEELCLRHCDLGVVPLENSLQGTVGASFDLFLKYPVHIQAELYSRISHCLLSDATSLAAVRTVHSHPQPLAQCGVWLRTHLPNAVLVPAESTAAAAHRAAGDPEAAAIGHASLASLAGIGILARRIEDEAYNWTRFVIIATSPSDAGRPGTPLPTPGNAGGACKTSILFTLPDKPGALSTVLQLLAENGINMRKLESRPLRDQCWKYAFFADVESNLEDEVHLPLLKRLEEVCSSFRILGSYPSGPQLDRPDVQEA
ncbi:MAG: prephenate dehydratase [Desulfovibrio sp.]|nr:prephenate dehydratase [Desulfovibrio sp.]